MEEPKYTIKDRLGYLIDLKTLVTLSLTATFIYLAVDKSIVAEDFIKIYLMIIVFYFGVQSGKASN